MTIHRISEWREKICDSAPVERVLGELLLACSAAAELKGLVQETRMRISCLHGQLSVSRGLARRESQVVKRLKISQQKRRAVHAEARDVLVALRGELRSHELAASLGDVLDSASSSARKALSSLSRFHVLRELQATSEALKGQRRQKCAELLRLFPTQDDVISGGRRVVAICEVKSLKDYSYCGGTTMTGGGGGSSPSSSSNPTPQAVEAALGHVAQIVYCLAAYLDICLPAPTFFGRVVLSGCRSSSSDSPSENTGIEGEGGRERGNIARAAHCPDAMISCCLLRKFLCLNDTKLCDESNVANASHHNYCNNSAHSTSTSHHHKQQQHLPSPTTTVLPIEDGGNGSALGILVKVTAQAVSSQVSATVSSLTQRIGGELSQRTSPRHQISRSNSASGEPATPPPPSADFYANICTSSSCCKNLSSSNHQVQKTTSNICCSVLNRLRADLVPLSAYDSPREFPLALSLLSCSLRTLGDLQDAKVAAHEEEPLALLHRLLSAKHLGKVGGISVTAATSAAPTSQKMRTCTADDWTVLDEEAVQDDEEGLHLV